MSKVGLRKNKNVDFIIGMLDSEVPTKQDKFKPLGEFELVIDKEKYNGENSYKGLYEKNEELTKSQKEYKEKFIEIIKSEITNEHPYKKEKKLEVVVSILVKNEKRMEIVDIDNLIKFVLDCFKGLVYEDDAQIIAVLGHKKLSKMDSLLVGIREVSDTKPSLFKDISIAHFETLDN